MKTGQGPDSDAGPDGVDGQQARYDWEAVQPSTAVVEAVADADGRDAATLSPLYERVDPDALDEVVSPHDDRDGSADVSVSFPFEGYTVSVFDDGTILLRPMPY